MMIQTHGQTKSRKDCTLGSPEPHRLVLPVQKQSFDVKDPILARDAKRKSFSVAMPLVTFRGRSRNGFPWHLWIVELSLAQIILALSNTALLSSLSILDLMPKIQSQDSKGIQILNILWMKLFDRCRWTMWLSKLHRQHLVQVFTYSENLCILAELGR